MYLRIKFICIYVLNLYVFMPRFLAELFKMLGGTQGLRWTLAGKIWDTTATRQYDRRFLAALYWGATARYLDFGQSRRMNEAFVTEWRKNETKGSWCMNWQGDGKNDSYWIKEI